MMDRQSSQSTQSKKTRDRRVWTKIEEDLFIDILEDLVNAGWKSDNGFRPGMYSEIERRMEAACPGCGIRPTPHVESKLKVLKKQYNIVYDMLNHSGFTWDSDRKCVIAEDSIWEEYIKKDNDAKLMKNKPFPYYERLSIVFGKDRMISRNVETLEDAIEKLNEEEVDKKDDMEVSSPHSIAEASTGRSHQGRKRKDREDSKIASHVAKIGEYIGVVASKMGDLADNIAAMSNQFGHDKDLAKMQKGIHEQLKKLPLLASMDIFFLTRYLGTHPDELMIFSGMETIEDKLGFLQYIMEHERPS
ncbi:hypothetical protein Cni_G28576 [Canna indica]|uniref:Myb/SANT-like domain-containing protein n=1 Tax=Canna indica TaxID=4628 RepID=A0AAQ3L393_9LILI|nr:hypothetical protein Cni_G28576 [Canna indica]